MNSENDPLWNALAGECTLLRRRRRAPELHTPPSDASAAPFDAMHAFTPPVFSAGESAPAAAPSGADLSAAIGKSARRKLRAGKTAPQARIDLHGMTRDRAFAFLAARLPSLAAQGASPVLIITGKGEGILQSALPAMLTGTELSRYIVCYEQASPAHGGSGAFYVALRRTA